MHSLLEIPILSSSRFLVLWLRKPFLPHLTSTHLHTAGEFSGKKGNRAGERQPDQWGPEEQAETGEHAAGAQVRCRVALGRVALSP